MWPIKRSYEQSFKSEECCRQRQSVTAHQCHLGQAQGGTACGEELTSGEWLVSASVQPLAACAF